MKIKHYQGYGTVQAKKIAKTDNFIHIRVWGDHEYGLERNDWYDVFNWLVKKFDKKHKDCRDIRDVRIDDCYKVIDGIDTEVCDYKIYFKEMI